MSQTRDFDVLGIGELNPDRVLAGIQANGPVLGTEQEFASETLVLGSSTAIACVLMQRLGLRTALAASVGDDDMGQFCLDVLDAESVCRKPVRVIAGQKTGITYSITYPSDRMLLTRLGTLATFTADDVDRNWLARTRHVHSGSFFVLPKLRYGLRGLFQDAKANGASTSLDFGWDTSGHWDQQALADVLPFTDVVFPNLSELKAATGASTLKSGIAKLHEFGVGDVVVKLGKKGALASIGGEVFEHPGYPAQTFDTTGAGDAFNAGYLRAQLAGFAAIDCLRLGNACGACTVQAVGGTGGLQRLDQVLEMMSSTGEDALELEY